MLVYLLRAELMFVIHFKFYHFLMESIELFAGKATFSEIAKTLGFNTTSVDIDPKSNASIIADLLKWDYTNLNIKPDLIWASPECTYFSRAANQNNWKKTNVSRRVYHYEPVTLNASLAIELVSKTIEIISYFKPSVFFIENPIGRIQHLQSLKDIGHYRYFVNYADWGFNYSKETYIFTNILLPLPSTKQKCKSPGLRTLSNKKNRSRIPPTLLEFLIKKACQNLKL